MVRHNNQVPNQHFHKDWQNRVKTWFDQVRSLARASGCVYACLVLACDWAGTVLPPRPWHAVGWSID